MHWDRAHVNNREIIRYPRWGIWINLTWIDAGVNFFFALNEENPGNFSRPLSKLWNLNKKIESTDHENV